MHRIHPSRIKDKFYLSALLEQYLRVLAESPLQMPLHALSHDTGIPEVVFARLTDLHKDRADAANISVADFYVVFANVMFRFPTVRMYAMQNGALHFEL